MTKNDAVAAIVEKLTQDIPGVYWTRECLFEGDVQRWPTGCVVAYHWTAEGDQGCPRIWTGSVAVRIYAHHQGDPYGYMGDLLDAVEESLSETEAPGILRVQLHEASIIYEEKATTCGLHVELSITL